MKEKEEDFGKILAGLKPLGFPGILYIMLDERLGAY